MKAKPMVFLCGLPCSGNKVVEAAIRRCAKVYIRTYIYHGHITEEIPSVGNDHKCVAVLPVRDEPTRLLAARERGLLRLGPEVCYPVPSLQMRLNIETLDEETLNLPVWHISYEAFVAHPNHALAALLQWLRAKLDLSTTELSWEPFPRHRIPGQPEHEGPIFDGNARRMSLSAVSKS